MRTTFKHSLRTTVGALLLAACSLASAETTTTTTTETKTTKKKTDSAAPAADNTKVNERDRSKTAVTADQQKNNKTDLQLTAEIRRAVIAEKSLSVNAHNIKIIAVNGTVTLKGPVKNVSEKTTIEEKAVAAVGKANVKSEIEVQP